MNVASARSLYDNWHARYEVDKLLDTPWHRLLLRHLDPVRDLAGRRVLEVACGRGGLASKLTDGAHRPLTFVAADFSVTALEKGRRHAWKETGPSPCWSATDLQALAFRNATFDTVISCESIEHIERPRQACEEFARVLRVGGRLYLTTPNYMGPLGLYRGYRRLVNRPFTEEGQPINRFMLLPILCWWLRRAGFRLLTVAGTGHYLPWPGRPPIALTQLDSRVLFRWLALHSLVVAERA